MVGWEDRQAKTGLGYWGGGRSCLLSGDDQRKERKVREQRDLRDKGLRFDWLTVDHLLPLPPLN